MTHKNYVFWNKKYVVETAPNKCSKLSFNMINDYKLEQIGSMIIKQT